MKVYSDVIQGTEEWKQLRFNKITASDFNIATARGRKKGEPSVQIMPLIYKILSEKITGIPVERFQNEWMDWGTEHEDQARAMYELKHPEYSIVQVGFVEKNDFIGCSPDGIIYDKSEKIIGGLELKCPTSHVQIKRKQEGVLPSEYKKQVYGSIWICEAEWWDFVSFDPRLPEPMNYFEIRVYRDEKIIDELAQGVKVFVEKMIAVEKSIMGG